MAGYLTEEDARKLWCPHISGIMAQAGRQIFLTSRGHRSDIPAQPVDTDVPAPLTTCIGSMCRHWDWNDGETRGICALENRHTETPSAQSLVHSNIEAWTGVVNPVISLTADISAFVTIPIDELMPNSTPRNMNVSNGRIDVDSDGFFYLSAMIRIIDAQTNAEFDFQLRVNGVDRLEHQRTWPTRDETELNVPIPVISTKLNKGDYLEVLTSSDKSQTPSVYTHITLWTPGAMIVE